MFNISSACIKWNAIRHIRNEQKHEASHISHWIVGLQLGTKLKDEELLPGVPSKDFISLK